MYKICPFFFFALPLRHSMHSTEIPLSSFSIEFTMKSETSINNSMLLSLLKFWLKIASLLAAKILTSQTYQLFSPNISWRKYQTPILFMVVLFYWMAFVGLRVIKCKHHYKSRDIGEDDGPRIMANYHSLWVSLRLLCTFHAVSLQISNCWWLHLTVQIMHVFFILCCSTFPVCVEQHKVKKTCVICTGVVWLGSPATIALVMLHTNEVICKLTAWDILFPVRVLLYGVY